jgi:hypothetical protein
VEQDSDAYKKAMIQLLPKQSASFFVEDCIKKYVYIQRTLIATSNNDAANKDALERK